MLMGTKARAVLLLAGVALSSLLLPVSMGSADLQKREIGTAGNEISAVAAPTPFCCVCPGQFYPAFHPHFIVCCCC